MKVLWVHNFPTSEGAGGFVTQQLEFIKKNYKDIYVDELELKKIANPFKVIMYILYIKKIESNYDLIHSQYGSMCSFIVSFSKLNKILTLRGSDWHRLNEGNWKFRLHNFFQRMLTRSVLKKYELIISVSKRIQNEIKQLANRNSVVIPSPVDMNKFYPVEKEKIVTKMEFSHEIYYILFPVFSRENAVKRDWFVKELEQYLKEKYSNIEIIYASGIQHEEMNDLYNIATAVVLPSQFEGWPNVIKEAMLCNVPFVATDISDLSDLVNEKNNCFVCNLDVVEFGHCIQKIIDSDADPCLREQMAIFNMADLTFDLIKQYRTIDGLALKDK